MARTIYGAELFKAPDGTGASNYASGPIGANNEVFVRNCPVVLGTGKWLTAYASNTQIVIGVAAKTVTMASTNQTVAKVKPQFTPIDQDYEFLMGTDADISPTSVGVYYKLTGTATTVQVYVSGGAETGSARFVLCTGADPLDEGGTGASSGARQGLFKFARVYNIKSDAAAGT